MRNQYNALMSWPEWTKTLNKQLEAAGAWETGITSNKSGRGVAINVDLFGYDEAQQLAVIQVRQARFHPSKPTQVRKNYYLCGWTESGTPFAHPVDTPARSRTAMKTPEACVTWVLTKIWDCKAEDLPDIERQGDLAMIPIREIPKTALPVEGPVTFRDTHEVRGDLWRDWDGTYYTRRGARMIHTKRQHEPVRAKAGVYRIQEGVRVPTWSFSMRVGD